MQETYYCYYDSPIGQLLLSGSATSLELVSFPKGKMAKDPHADWIFAPKYFKEPRQQLQEYFAGTRISFDLNYTLRGTAFQQKVLRCVAVIPYGTTSSYSDIAEQIEHPLAVRAVGMANSKNNLPIIIPCHRVVGKNGDLTGFGGGIETKKFLLNLEQADC